MKPKWRKQTNTIWKRIAKAHVRISVWMFVGYLVLATAYSPEFLLADMRHKWSALADDTITITGRVLGPPQKPTVTAEPICHSGNLSVSLDWADDDNSRSFNIMRDGLPLVTGLPGSSYVDTSVAMGSVYSYEVVARGAMDPGMAISEAVSVTMPAECKVVFVPIVAIATFQGKAVSSYPGVPETDVALPTVTGTTNIPYAQIDYMIAGPTVVSGRVSANVNGYWNFEVPTGLPYGTSTVFVKASDPANLSVSVSSSLTFRIVQTAVNKPPSTDTHSKTTESKEITTVPVPTPPSLPESRDPSVTAERTVPVDFTLRPDQGEMFQGRPVTFSIYDIRVNQEYVGTIAAMDYVIVDTDGNTIASSTGSVTLEQGALAHGEIALPSYVRDGSYRLRAEMRFRHFLIRREAPITILPLPILSLGGGLLFTYPELVSKIGTISILLLLLLLLWGVLFWREYLLYAGSLRNITERNLIRAGLFGWTKGKGVSD
ncbi:MAG: hypothetical protein WCL23_00025 [Candidatus Moraniibacteriota bacterium]